MIAEEIQNLLYDAVKIYDKYIGSDYLIIARSNPKMPIDFFQIRMKEENYWHLIGCGISKKSKFANHQLYQMCLDRKPIAEYLEYAKGGGIVISRQKYGVFTDVFDFVDKAKRIRICDTENTPDRFNFAIAAGYDSGIIGYAREKDKSLCHPKTSQTKSIESFNANKQARRIMAVLSKPCSNSLYSDVVFEYKKDVLKSIINEIDEGYRRKIDRALYSPM